MRIDRTEDAPHIIRVVCGELLGADPPKEHTDLMLSTAVVESEFKTRRQYGDGVARGYWQVEPDTAYDNLENYIRYKIRYWRVIAKSLFDDPDRPYETLNKNFIAGQLEQNDEFCIMMARIKYLRIPKAIPMKPAEQAWYWKHYYNTLYGAGSMAKYLKKRIDYQVEKLIELEYTLCINGQPNLCHIDMGGIKTLE